MGKSIISLMLMCTIAVVLVAMANGEAPSTICNVKISELVECLPAITGKCPPPTKACCSVMRKADLHCLCSYKSKFKEIGANPTKAMALPGQCGLKLPTQCKKN